MSSCWTTRWDLFLSERALTLILHSLHLHSYAFLTLSLCSSNISSESFLLVSACRSPLEGHTNGCNPTCFHSLFSSLGFSPLLLLQIFLAQFFQFLWSHLPSPWDHVPSATTASCTDVRSSLIFDQRLYVIANFVIFSLIIKSSHSCIILSSQEHIFLEERAMSCLQYCLINKNSSGLYYFKGFQLELILALCSIISAWIVVYSALKTLITAVSCILWACWVSVPIKSSFISLST